MAPKFEQLKEVIGNNLDILIIQETKHDSSLPPGQIIKWEWCDDIGEGIHTQKTAQLA